MKKLDIRVSEQFIEMTCCKANMGPMWTDHSIFRNGVDHYRIIQESSFIDMGGAWSIAEMLGEFRTEKFGLENLLKG